jgi:hypothetical protein
MRIGVHLVSFDPATDAARFLEQVRALADAGIEEIHVLPLGAGASDPIRFVQDLGRNVVPRLPSP